MPVQAIILFLFALLTSAGLIAWTIRLRTRFSARYLDAYLVFIAVTCVYGLINWIGPFLVLAIVGDAPQANPMWLMATFVLFAVPFLLAKLAAFLTLLSSMNARHLPGRLIQVLTIGSALVVLASIIAVKAFFDGAGLDALRLFVIVFGVFSVTIQAAALAFLALRPEFHGDLNATAGRRWALTHLAGLGLYVLAAYAPVLGLGEEAVNAAPYLYFLMHIAPLLVLHRHLMQAGAPRLSEDDLFGSVAERFGLTRRECEILGLVSTGQSNAEIADQLCVSAHTVKNHIYNIYKKTGIKSRVQLASLIMKAGAD